MTPWVNSTSSPILATALLKAAKSACAATTGAGGGSTGAGCGGAQASAKPEPPAQQVPAQQAPPQQLPPQHVPVQQVPLQQLAPGAAPLAALVAPAPWPMLREALPLASRASQPQGPPLGCGGEAALAPLAGAGVA